MLKLRPRLLAVAAAFAIAGAASGVSRAADPGLAAAAAAAPSLLERAVAGDATAQLRLAVALEVGGPRDREAAHLWYARAAARGEARAQHFLGLLYETGDGVPLAPGIARAWYEAAAERLPAAAERLASMGAAALPEGPSAPSLVLAEAVPEAGIDLVWTSPPQPEGTIFRVVLRGGEPGSPPVHVEELARTALVVPLQSGLSVCCARVEAVDRAGGRYAASEWMLVDPAAPPPGAFAGTEIAVSVAGLTAEELAEDLSADFAASGLRVLLEAGVDAGGPSGVFYSFAEDRGLAEALAALVPGGLAVARADPADSSLPGRIEVRIAGGLAEQ